MTLMSSSFYHCLFFFRINVKKDDGSIEERDLKKGDLTLLLKWENDQNYFTLSEH